MSSDLRRKTDEVLRRVERLGYRVERNDGHAKVFSEDGRLLASLGTTPSDVRSVRNGVADLRRAGVDVRWPQAKRKGVVDDRQADALLRRLATALAAGFSIRELSRHAMTVAEAKGIRAFSNEHSGEVTIAGLRGGRRVSKWSHDLLCATLSDIEQQPGSLADLGDDARALLDAPLPPSPPASPRERPDSHALAEEWETALDAQIRAMTLFKAAIRRTLEERR